MISYQITNLKLNPRFFLMLFLIILLNFFDMIIFFLKKDKATISINSNICFNKIKPPASDNEVQAMDPKLMGLSQARLCIWGIERTNII